MYYCVVFDGQAQLIYIERLGIWGRLLGREREVEHFNAVLVLTTF